MKLFCCVFLVVALAFAGRTSQWSSVFTLTDASTAIKKVQAQGQVNNKFDLVLKNNPHASFVTFLISGIEHHTPVSLKIYSVNGKLVADLSQEASSGLSTVVWKRPIRQTGLFFANLKKSGQLKTVKFIVVK